MTTEDISINLEHFRPVELNCSDSSLMEELSTVLPELDRTIDVVLNWGCCGTVCCPQFLIAAINSEGSELCSMSGDPTTCSCFCSFGLISSAQNIIFRKEEGSDEILRVSYDPEVWLGTGSFQPRVINIHLLGRTDPTGKIVYNSKCMNQINSTDSGKMINLSTNEVFTFSQVEGNEDSIMILDSTGVQIAYAVVTRIMQYKGNRQAIQWTLRYSSNDGISSMNKCLILGAITIWIIGDKESDWKWCQILFPIFLAFSAIVLTVALFIRKTYYENSEATSTTTANPFHQNP